MDGQENKEINFDPQLKCFILSINHIEFYVFEVVIVIVKDFW